MNRGDRDILLPEEHDPWQILRDLRSLLARRRRPRSVPVVQTIEPEDLCLAFEYLAVECQAVGHLLEDLAEPLAVRMTALTGQNRYDMQCKLAEALGRREGGRFFVAVHLATRVPVPQARSPLLGMLTQANLGRWSFVDARQTPMANGIGRTFDLRPAVVAALGQLRDPSLLGLFHRLLEKLSGSGRANEPVVAAVQWSLMNLAPGGQGEPVPMTMLNGTMTAGEREGQARPAARSETVVPRGTAGQPTNGGRGGGARSDGTAAASGERNELLADF
jgi:hypothetical protein